jgi:hypothetical protein
MSFCSEYTPYSRFDLLALYATQNCVSCDSVRIGQFQTTSCAKIKINRLMEMKSYLSKNRNCITRRQHRNLITLVTFEHDVESS